jgi:DNA-binding transcriptional ArsR family regulator
MKGKPEVMTARELARRIDVPHSTVSQWLQKGQVPGAEAQSVGDYKIWVIPVEVVDSYPEWRPKRGRPTKKEGSKKTAKKAKRGAANK